MMKSKTISCISIILLIFLFLFSCGAESDHSEVMSDSAEKQDAETNMRFDEETNSLNELIENHYNTNYGLEAGTYIDFIFPIRSLVDDRESWYACVIASTENDDYIECFLYYTSENGQLYCYGNNNRLFESADFPKDKSNIGEYYIWYKDLGYYTDEGKRVAIDEKDMSESALYYRKRRNLLDERKLAEGIDAIYDFPDVFEPPGDPYPRITIISSDCLNFEY